MSAPDRTPSIANARTCGAQHPRRRFRALAAFAALVLATLAMPATAALFIVGTPVSAGQCTHSTIQAAINAAEASPGEDTIWITRSLSYTAQELLVNTSQSLNIFGGYATCTSSPDATNTTISGAGGNTRQVLRVFANTAPSRVLLSNVRITGGDEAGAGEGGGIYFQGNGTLEIRNSSIAQNISGYGAGIYARGTGADARLTIGANVVINNNTARYSGGGVYIDQITMDMVEPGSIILNNIAQGTAGSGFGGGLTILGRSRSAIANIGSGGFGNLGVIHGNSAVRGGGVALVGDDNNSDDFQFSELRLSTTVAGRPPRISANSATAEGGGIYARSFAGGAFTDPVVARTRLWNPELLDNDAPNGAAIYLARTTTSVFQFGQGGELYVNRDGPTFGMACPVDAPCGRIAGNVARVIGGAFTDGAVIHAERDTRTEIAYLGQIAQSRGVHIHDNRAGRVIDSQSYVNLRSTLISNNEVSQQLLRFPREDDGTWARLFDVTIAGNSIGAAHVIASGVRTTLNSSILWQPFKLSLDCDGCTREDIRYVLTSERGTLDFGNTPYVFADPPRFVDPARADYRLRAASPAVDSAPSGFAGDRDLLGLPRDQDLPVKANRFGVRDLGAYERQTLLPLVLFGDFDVAGDLALWPVVTANASTHDTSQNAPGQPVGSGSISVNFSNFPPPRVVARQQCIHLPGPGRYKLNGWGRSFGALGPERDGIVLQWDLRFNGTESCTSGPVNGTGNHFLTTSTSWVRPANPAVIEVPALDWTWTSSLTVSLVVFDNGTVGQPNNVARGWFDGITLEVEPLDDVIFANGFDS